MSAVLEAPRVNQASATQDAPSRFSYRALGIAFQDSAFVPIGHPTIVPRDFVSVYQKVANELTDSNNAFLRIFEAEEPAKAVGRPVNPEREAVIVYAGNRSHIPVFLGATNRVLDEVTARDMREDPKGTKQILAKKLDVFIGVGAHPVATQVIDSVWYW